MSLDISTVGTAIKLAWQIYDLGFKKEKSSPQRYVEFGSALHGLYGNLKTIETTVQRASDGLRSEKLGSFGPPVYDLSSLAEIIGNFKVTLDECRDLLNDESKFRQKNGFITNILYNIDVDPQVIHLTERLAFHNNKISLVLDPFKLHLQTELRSLHKEQHQDLAEIIQELRSTVVKGLDLKDEPSPAPPRDLEIPVEISERFVVACGPRSKDENEDKRMFPDFPLREGLEAFFYHFNGMSQSIDSMSYLRLMKSVWIMDRIRESNDWAKIQRSNPGGLYDRCVREMDRRLRSECSRVPTSQIPLPELLLQLPADTFSIWPPVIPTGDSSQVHHLGVLLDVPILPDPKSHTLRIVRNIDGTLGVEDTTVTTTESTGTLASERRIQTLNIDPKSAYFVPIYAMPVETGSRPPALTIKLQSSRDGVNGIAPEFESVDDLLRLQHLATGYRCVKRRNGVTITSLSEGQDFPIVYSTNSKKKPKKTPKEIFEYGNIQMWQRTPYDPKPSSPRPPNRDLANRRASLFSTTATAMKSINGSSMSFSTLGSTLSAHTQLVALGSSSTGIQFQEPTPPILVLFLKETEHGLLSFLVIELDEFTHMNPFSCKCGSPKKTCTVSVLERSKKPLLARRFYAKQGLNSWNLAALGEDWGSGENGAVVVRDMNWLRFNFKTEAERVKFNEHVWSLVALFTRNIEGYRKDLQSIRKTHIISRKS